MKNLLKGTISFLIMVASTTVLASAQPLVGLPQYGVLLGGEPANPVVLNNSGKTILAYSILFSDAQGKNGLTGIVTDTDSLRNRQATLPDAFTRMNSHLQPARAELDSVVFGNGLLVGPDKGNAINIITAEIDTERHLGSDVFTRQTSWAQLQNMLAKRGPGRPSGVQSNLEQKMILEAIWGAQRMLAQNLLRAHERDGDSRAFEIADFSRHLPQVGRSLLAKQTIFPILAFPFRLIAALLGGEPAFAQNILGNWYIDTYLATLDGWNTATSAGQIYYNQTIPYGSWAPGPYSGSFAGNHVQCWQYHPGTWINTGMSQACNCDAGCYVVLQVDQGQQINEPPGYTLVTSDHSYDPNDPTWLVSYGTVGEDCERTYGYWIGLHGSTYCTRQ